MRFTTNPECPCGAASQTMEHILRYYPIVPNCFNQHLKEINNTVQKWVDVISFLEFKHRPWKIVWRYLEELSKLIGEDSYVDDLWRSNTTFRNIFATSMTGVSSCEVQLLALSRASLSSLYVDFWIQETFILLCLYIISLH